MPNPYDPFRPWFEPHPDYNRADERRVVEQMLIRDDLTRGYLDQTVDLETLWDCMAEHGLDPLEWAEEAANGVQRIVDGGMAFVTNESGLYIPER
jgi:hypothetical protein